MGLIYSQEGQSYGLKLMFQSLCMYLFIHWLGAKFIYYHGSYKLKIMFYYFLRFLYHYYIVWSILRVNFLWNIEFWVYRKFSAILHKQEDIVTNLLKLKMILTIRQIESSWTFQILIIPYPSILLIQWFIRI